MHAQRIRGNVTALYGQGNWRDAGKSPPQLPRGQGELAWVPLSGDRANYCAVMIRTSWAAAGEAAGFVCQPFPESAALHVRPA